MTGPGNQVGVRDRVVRRGLLLRQVGFALALVSCAGCLAGKEIAVTAKGAVPDGKTPATAAIQAALDEAVAGDTVVVPAGRFLCGTVDLRSGVRLRLEEGAVILASRREEDYAAGGAHGLPVMLRGVGIDNVVIEGKGVIDGQAEHQWRVETETDGFIREETENARRAGIELKRAFALPPKASLVFFRNCREVRMNGVSVLRSPHWSVHFAACHDVRVEGVRIESSLTEGVNSDGLDIDGCRQVSVRGCVISTGDDAICLKSTKSGAGGAACEDITVEDCLLTSTSCALKIGTETFGDFRRIVFRECVVRDSNRGIGIFVRDGATVSDVLFSKIRIECRRKHYHWWGDGDPLRFVVLKRNPDSKAGRIEKVTVEDLRARGQGSCLIAGLSGNREIDGVTLRRVDLTVEAEDKPDKRATDAVIVRDAGEVVLEQVRVKWDCSKGREAGWGKGLRVERTSGLKVVDCEFPDAPRLER